MNTVDYTITTGLQTIQRAAFKILYSNFNDSLEEQALYWDTKDEELSIFLGEPTFTPTVLEPVLDANFYEGHRPSLLEAPKENYPNCCAIVDKVVRAPVSPLDHASTYQATLAIELMAKSNNDENEVNKRISRMVDAAVAVIGRYQTLDGVVNELVLEPTVMIGGVFTRRDKTSHGNKWLWQGARIEFLVDKVSAPHNQLENPDAVYMDFDQG